MGGLRDRGGQGHAPGGHDEGQGGPGGGSIGGFEVAKRDGHALRCSPRQGVHRSAPIYLKSQEETCSLVLSRVIFNGWCSFLTSLLLPYSARFVIAGHSLLSSQRPEVVSARRA